MGCDPFHKLFLDSLELTLNKEPSHHGMLELLQHATPNLDEASLQDGHALHKSFKVLLARCHPDKHPNDTERATRLCQDAQTFFHKCESLPVEKPNMDDTTKHGARAKGHHHARPKSSSPTSVPLPFEFKASVRWPSIQRQYKYPRWQNGLTKGQIAACVAYQCINSRGAVAHGKETDFIFGAEQVKGEPHSTSVASVFQHRGGYKELTSINEIKQEIMTRGPVVSVSHSHSPCLQHQRELLIVGWKLNEFGEMWLVQPLSRDHNTESPNIPVAMGQFGIDDQCLAPSSPFEDMPWEHGPYLDLDMSTIDPKWRSDERLSIQMDVSMDNLELLFQQLGRVKFACSTSSSESLLVTLREATKYAHSRKGVLKEMEWTHGQWKLTIDFV